MARRSSALLVLLLAGFLVGVGGLAAWVLDSSSEQAEVQASALAAPDRAPPARAGPELRAPEADALVESTPAESGSAAPATAGARSQRQGAEDAELAGAYWIEGRVSFPSGTPFGEEVTILANGKSFENRPLHRAEVRSDGSFRVAFAPETRTGWLVMEADHLYIDKPLRVKPKNPPEEIELKAKLGGRIAGVVLVPPLDEDDRAELLGTKVELKGVQPDMLTDVGHKRSIELHDRLGQLAFAFGGLPPGLDYEIALDTDVMARAELDGLSITPGETTEVELEVTLGVRVSGTVLGEDGTPVDRVHVYMISHDDAAERRFRQPDKVEVAENGTFLARGVTPGEIAVVARAAGHVGQRVDLGERADGDQSEGLQLVLGPGHAVRGRVQWPEGDGVSECTLELRHEFEEDDDLPFKVWLDYLAKDEIEVETGPDGSFEITGLGPGPYVIDASAVRPDEKGRRRKKGPRWNAHLEEVAADSEGLVITLGQGLVVSGRVVDENGASLERFVVQAMPEDGRNSIMTGGNWWFDSDEGLSRKFYKAGGLFSLDGFKPGRWRVRALAKGHQDADTIAVELPGEGAGVVLTLLRVASVSGVVLDPGGLPVSGARVSVDAKGGPDWLRFMDKHGARTDENGAFEVDDAPTGRVSVSAKAGGFAPSQAYDLELRPGDVEQGVALSLRKGGRITGRLLSTGGEPVVGRKIEIDLGQWSFLDRSTRTDASGAFSFENLPPGTYALSASLSDEERRALEDDADWAAKESAKKHATVVIAGEETVHVMLGAPPENAVLVTGVVTRLGEPVEGVQVRVNSVDANVGQQSRVASSAADGSYEVVLDQPGEYSFSVSGEKGASRSHVETVPDVDTHRVDVELPAGAIAGRIVGPDGAPMPEVPVTLSASEETAETSRFGVSGWQRTEQDGSFRFNDVAPGDYVVTGGPSLWDRSSEAEYGTAVAEVTLDEDQVVEGVELVVDRAATISGTVLDPDGRPVSGASIFVRNEKGALLSTWSMVVTDGAGRFRHAGLNPGTWTLSARRATTASVESRPIRVSAGGTVEVRLELELSTMLIVHTEDADGNPVGASFSVTDEGGREYRSMQALMDQGLEDDYQDGLARVAGPLPPGKYRVVVSNHDGVSAEQEVKLAGEERRELRLRLEGE